MAKTTVNFQDKKSHVNIYLAPLGGFKQVTDIIEQPLINYNAKTWNDKSLPIMKISSSSIKSLLKDIVDDPHGTYWFYFPDFAGKGKYTNWGVFCSDCISSINFSPTDIVDYYTGSNCSCIPTSGILPGSLPHLTASADAYYLPI